MLDCRVGRSLSSGRPSAEPVGPPRNDAAEVRAAAGLLGDAARGAPWVAEYHYRLGVLLTKAERETEAARAFELYLRATPDAVDRDAVRSLIAALGGITRAQAPAVAAKPP